MTLFIRSSIVSFIFFDHPDNIFSSSIPNKEIVQDSSIRLELEWQRWSCIGKWDTPMRVLQSPILFSNHVLTQNIFYCLSTIPEVGGHTNFRNAGVHVKPTTGGAVFFSYIDPEKKITDKGFTEHSGCPVLKGEKKIVTQWIRLGVDDDNPWDSFDTSKFEHRCYTIYEHTKVNLRAKIPTELFFHVLNSLIDGLKIGIDDD